MWSCGDSSETSQTSYKSENLVHAKAIKVLVVDHNVELLYSMVNILECFSFEVTCADRAAAALAILSEKEDEFELVLVDSHLTDVDTHAFLRLTKKMDLLRVVMSEDMGNAVLTKAFKNGAFLVIRKPLNGEILEQIRQHVIRKRITMSGNESCDSRRKERKEPRKNVRKSSVDKYPDVQSSESDSNNVKKKTCMEWTEELHEKFMNAISHLGEGRCYPNQILEVMDVPGLTRMQVASHLQKCRNPRWGSSEMKEAPSSSRNSASSHKCSLKRIDKIKFGSMPPLQKDPTPTREDNTLSDVNLSSNGKQKDVDVTNHQTSQGGSLMETSGMHNVPEDNGEDESPHQESLDSTAAKSTGDYYVPQIPDEIPVFAQAPDFLANLPLERAPGDPFFDFMRDKDANSFNIFIQPGGPAAYQGLITGDFASSYDEVMPTQDYAAGNKNINKQRR